MDLTVRHQVGVLRRAESYWQMVYTRKETMILARIPEWNEHDPSTPPEVREVLGYTEQRFGQNLNIFREMANNPAIARAFTDLTMVYYGEDSTITPAHRELAYTTASVVNSCHY